jgi:hypothetical protein
MSNQQGNQWKRRVIRQIITLGTVSSVFAGTLIANPPGLPGLPGSEPSVTGSNGRPQMLPVPQLQPGSSLRSVQTEKIAPQGYPASSHNETGNAAVNIKILPGLPPAGLPATAAADVRASGPAVPEKGTVQVKMKDSAAPLKAMFAPAPLSTSYVTSSVAVTSTEPMTIENGKANTGGPVKLSIGDSGIVDLGVQRPRQDAVVTTRAPELVKPKKYSVSQPVVLAQAAELPAAEKANGVPQSASDQVTTALAEPSLPVGVPAMESAEGQLPIATLPNNSLAGNAPTQSAPIAVDVRLIEPPVAHASPLAPPKTSRPAAGAATSSSVAVVPVKPAEPTLPQPTSLPLTKAAGTQDDTALRQHAQRHKPEKTYDIESRGTYSIDTPFLVAATASLDNNICTVFNNGNSITIAGGATGNTRVAIASQTGETRVIEVNVLPVGQQLSRPQSEIDQVKELIGQVFPDARVQIVSLPTGEVEVKGITSTESDARKILELVRKVCLVPVHDRLKSGR